MIVPDEVKNSIKYLQQWCESSNDWELSYFALFLKLFKFSFHPSPGTSLDPEGFWCEKTDQWLELMAFCEYQSKSCYIESGNELDPLIMKKINEIRSGKILIK